MSRKILISSTFSLILFSLIVGSSVSSPISIQSAHAQVSDTTWVQWKHVSEGKTIPGAPVTAVYLPTGKIQLFIANPTGVVLTSLSSVGIWTDWTDVSEGKTTPGGTVSAKCAGGHSTQLFLADPNGVVYTTFGAP